MTPIFDEIRPADLADWARTPDCVRVLPSLIRQLILSSGANVTSCRFLTHEQSDLGGWDGLVTAGKDGLYVPKGPSGWELSKESAVTDKADRDFTERTRAPGELKPSQSHYRALTLRVWPRRRWRGKMQSSSEHKATWSSAKKRRGKWLSVEVLDAVDIAAWIAKAPGVGLWVAELMQRRAHGAYSLISHWADLSTLKPKLKPKTFLAGRHEFKAALDAWISRPPSALAVRSWSVEDVRDAVSAWWADRTEAGLITAIVPVGVATDEAWVHLARTSHPMLLFADSGVELRSEMASAAVARGHYVLSVSNQEARGAACPLADLRRDQLAVTLLESGMDQTDANRIAREMVGSGVAFKRLLTGHSANPVWAKGPEATAVAPAALLGSWDGESAGDRRQVSLLFRRSYTKVEQLLLPKARINDPLLRRKGKRWQIAGRADAWHWLSPWITAEQYARFQKVAETVLGEINPRYSLRADRRPFATIAGRSSRHSMRLRRALGESLCLLTLHPEAMPNGRSTRDLGRAIIGRIFRKAKDWKFWASLDFALIYLAEAAPDLFLGALESDLARANSAVVRLFGEGGGAIFGDHPHVEVMWALETLLWNTEWAPRVLLILARLAVQDPGDNVHPRPIGVLREALLPWHPQCALNPQERRQVLEQIVSDVTDVGWKLLFELIHKTRDVSSPSMRPSYFNSSPWVNRPVEEEERAQQESHAATLLVRAAGNDIERWKKLLPAIHRFPELPFALALEQACLLAEKLPEEPRSELWNCLRREVARHFRFADTDWALLPERRKALEALANALIPKLAILRHAWLFQGHPFLDFAEDFDDFSSDATGKRIESARVQALREIVQESGIAGIRSFATRIVEVGQVGSLLATHHLLIADSEILPGWLESDQKGIVLCARAYAFGRFTTDGWTWLLALRLQDWKPDTFGILSLILPFTAATWDQVESLGPAFSEAYWRTVPTFVLTGTPVDIERAIAKLLGQKRPDAALDCLSSARHAGIQVADECVLRALESLIKGLAEDESLKAAYATPNSLLPHWTNRAIMALQKSRVITADQRARAEAIEWFFLPAMRHDLSPKFSHDRLRREPSFFVDLVRMCSVPDGSKKRRRKPSAAEMSTAENSRRMIESLAPLPGLEATDKIDAPVFSAWVAGVRRLARAADFGKAIEFRLGKILTHSPADPAGYWPAAPVCRLLTDDSSEAMIRSFATAVFNMSGWPDPKAGQGLPAFTAGVEAKGVKLRELAGALRIRFPKVAQILTGVAESYDQVSARLRDDDD